MCDDGTLDRAECRFVGNELAQGKWRHFQLEANDIVVASSGSLGKRAWVRQSDLPLMLNTSVVRFRPLNSATLDQRFLWHFLGTQAFSSQYDKLRTGTAQLNFGPSHLRQMHIPLPPLEEQRRIADILDKADAIRRKRKEAITLTEDLLRSTFLEMFGDPVTNPTGWPVRALGEVFELEAGWSANGEMRSRNDDEYGVLKVSAVTSGVFRPEEHKAVEERAVDRELVTPRAGDLLFSRANTRELVAATCLVERDEPRLFLPDKLWRIVPHDGVATTPYLRFLLGHDRIRSELTKTATGTSGSMLNISMDKLRGLRGPLPPFRLQQRFSSLVWKSLKAKSRYEDAQRAADELFNALVARAFSREGAC
jgi:type I restriction enzyme S subunit